MVPTADFLLLEAMIPKHYTSSRMYLIPKSQFFASTNTAIFNPSRQLHVLEYLISRKAKAQVITPVKKVCNQLKALGIILGLAHLHRPFHKRSGNAKEVDDLTALHVTAG